MSCLSDVRDPFRFIEGILIPSKDVSGYFDVDLKQGELSLRYVYFSPFPDYRESVA